MRIRRLAAAALVAGGLALGGMVAPAAAAAAPAASTQLAESWWFAGNYPGPSACGSAGVKALFNTAAIDFECRRSGSVYSLYLLHIRP